MRRRNLIQKEYRDSDGYWIELKPGYVLSGEQTHGIVEDTKRGAYKKLAWVIPCECKGCLELIGQQAGR